MIKLRVLNRQTEGLYILLILISVFLSYGNALQNTFVYDDVFIVENNPNIRHLSNIPTLFTTGYWNSAGHTGGLYRPLTMLSYMMEYQLVGKSPFLYHLDNILLHLIFCVLAYFFVKKFLGPFGAFIASILFAAHPVHSEVVASVVGRADLLSSVFVLLSALVFLSRPPKTWKIAVSSIFFFFGLLSKESAIVMPVLLFAYIVIFEPENDKNIFWGTARRLLPVVAAFVVFMIIRVGVLGGHIGPASNETVFYNVRNYYTFLAICQIFYEYLRLSFLPFSLCTEYYFPPPESLFNFKVLFPIILLGLAFWSIFKIRHWGRVVPFALLWFFVGLLPFSNIIPIGSIMAERALYLPSLAACFFLSFLVLGFGKSPPASPVKSVLAVAAVIIITLSFAVGATRRNTVWRDLDVFYSDQIKGIKHRIELFPGHAPFYALLAQKYIQLGNFGREPEDALNAGLLVDPSSFEANLWLAYLYLNRSLPERALAYCMKASEKRPDDPDVLNVEGAALIMLTRYSEAEAVIDKSIRLYPDKANLFLNKGNLLMQKGAYGPALQVTYRTLELDPANYRAMLQASVILGSQGDFKGALKMAKDAAETDPKNAVAHYLMGISYVGLGRIDAATAELKTAIRLKPDYEEAATLLKRLSD